MENTIDNIFAISKDIRYVAIYKNNTLKTKSKSCENQSSLESDKYEELFINPTILKAASQRGNLDCGGLDYILIKYGNFFQCVVPIDKGHISVCIESFSNPVKIALKILKLIENSKL